MTGAAIDMSGVRLSGGAGLQAQIDPRGTVRRFDCGAVSLLLFPGNEIEGGLTNLYLRRRADTAECTALLGPRSPTAFVADVAQARFTGMGSWSGIDYALTLQLSQSSPTWFWHVWLHNGTATPQDLDLTYTQDLALAPYGAVRMNEYYVSQYLDHTPLQDDEHGAVVASRQNQAVDGRYPWCLLGSLRRAVSFATDAAQFFGLAGRAGTPPPGLQGDLPGRRLQHEHSFIALRDAPLQLGAGQSIAAGFFGAYAADHPRASSSVDLSFARQALRLPEGQPPSDRGAVPHSRQSGASAPAIGPRATADSQAAVDSEPSSWFVRSPRLSALPLAEAALRELFPPPWRHEERDASGQLLSFFHGADRHVVLQAKELRVQRPHGHLLRTGRHLTPAEAALTSTVWMSGTFHSQLTQGHASLNRCLSGVRGYLGLFRSHGQRVFIEREGRWQLLDVPSAFEMSPDACRWVYRHAGGAVEVCSANDPAPSQMHSGGDASAHTLTLSLRIASGPPSRFLITHHIALNGDDGAAPGAALWRRDGADIVLVPAEGSDLARRFPSGSLRLTPLDGTAIERTGGDELLFCDGLSRRLPYLCLLTAPANALKLALRAQLIGKETQSPILLRQGRPLIPHLRLRPPAQGQPARRAAHLAEIAPWFMHDALVHYLSPRGLEQYSGGGWGTRDVCQGPVELLLALGHTAALRDVLCRVMAAQNPDGDWPQWFMFYQRERSIRAGDSHGDIVLWPLVVLAQYLEASGDAGLLEERVPFFDARGPEAGESASVWQHAQRALALIERRLVPGTALIAYGHGDWNDSLQPVDPRMRERLCSAWTVTLHVQALTQLGRALRGIGRGADAAPLEKRAHEVRADFQRLLIADGVLAGYALFEEAAEPRLLLHPRDAMSGVHYSSLAMVHAILEDLLTPAQVRDHLQLIERHLEGPDGLRLFDQPLPYHGGPQRLFQRAESASFFGREIGLMYTHAHLRYAQALAHIGQAERFFDALCLANPIGIRSIVAAATLRQSNCYFSSSDAAFEDRYQASEQYQRIWQGTVALDGGWRVYSSGAGIAVGLIVRRLLGVQELADTVRIDPVMPAGLDGLGVQLTLEGQTLEAHYCVGSAGCGVRALRLNGAELPFTREANPHRPGAARLDRAALRAQLASQPSPRPHELLIELG